MQLIVIGACLFQSLCFADMLFWDKSLHANLDSVVRQFSAILMLIHDRTCSVAQGGRFE